MGCLRKARVRLRVLTDARHLTHPPSTTLPFQTYSFHYIHYRTAAYVSTGYPLGSQADLAVGYAAFGCPSSLQTGILEDMDHFPTRWGRPVRP